MVITMMMTIMLMSMMLMFDYGCGAAYGDEDDI